jgi:hypothetical protein
MFAVGQENAGGVVDFLETVPLDKLLNGSGWAVAFWAVLYVARMVYRGRLVPERTHVETVKALEIERKRNELLLMQLERATDSMETFEAFVRSLPQPTVIRVPSTQQQALPPRGGQPKRRDRDRRPSNWDDQWGSWGPPADGGPQPGDEGR